MRQLATLIERAFALGCFAGIDDANNFSMLTLAMTGEELERRQAANQQASA